MRFTTHAKVKHIKASQKMGEKKQKHTAVTERAILK